MYSCIGKKWSAFYSQKNWGDCHLTMLLCKDLALVFFSKSLDTVCRYFSVSNYFSCYIGKIIFIRQEKMKYDS